jgi:hypothetical protein
MVTEIYYGENNYGGIMTKREKKLEKLRENLGKIEGFSNKPKDIMDDFGYIPSNPEFVSKLLTLDDDLLGFLFKIDNRGKKKGVHLNKEEDGERICVGTLCNGKRKTLEHFKDGVTYCSNCKTYQDRYDIQTIFRSIKRRSKNRKKKYSNDPAYENVGDISPCIRLEVFYKLWGNNFHCALSNKELEDFTGLNKQRPKSIEKAAPLSAGDHWLVDRIDHRKGYTFDNIQIITRTLNDIKGKIEHQITKKRTNHIDKKTIAVLFDQLKETYDLK